MADSKDTKTGAANGSAGGARLCPGCGKPSYTKFGPFCTMCGSTMDVKQAAADAFAKLLNTDMAVTPLIYCRESLASAKWSSTIGALEGGWPHSVADLLRRTHICTSGDSAESTHSYHETDINDRSNLWPQGVDCTARTPAEIGTAINRALTARYRNGHQALQALPLLALCGVAHRLFPARRLEKTEQLVAGVESFEDLLRDLITSKIQRPVCGSNFMLKCTPSLGALFDAHFRLEKNHVVSLAAHAVPSMADLAARKYNGGGEDLVKMGELDKKFAAEQKVLDALIAQLPREFYYAPKARKLYTEAELAEVLAPVAKHMHVDLRKPPCSRQALGDKTVVLLSPEVETLIAELNRKQDILAMFIAMPPTNAAPHLIAALFGVLGSSASRASAAAAVKWRFESLAAPASPSAVTKNWLDKVKK